MDTIEKRFSRKWICVDYKPLLKFNFKKNSKCLIEDFDNLYTAIFWHKKLRFKDPINKS